MLNGDLGTIERINLSEQEVTVLFDDERAAAYELYQCLMSLILHMLQRCIKARAADLPLS